MNCRFPGCSSCKHRIKAVFRQILTPAISIIFKFCNFGKFCIGAGTLS